MNDQEKDIFPLLLAEHYNRMGQEVPEEAMFFMRTVILMDLELETSWKMLESLLPKAKSLLNAIDETIEHIVEQDPHERNFNTYDLRKIERDYWITDLQFPLAGSVFAYCTSNNETHLVRTKDPQTSYIFKGELGGIGEIADDLFYLAYLTQFDQVILWDLEKGILDQKLIGNHFAMRDGQMALSDREGKLTNLVPRLRKEIWSTKIDGDPISRIAVSGKIATTHASGKVVVWNQETPTTKWTFIDHLKEVPSIVFSSDYSLLATGSLDCTINIYEMYSGIKKNTLLGHQTGIRCLAFSPNGEILASGSDDGLIILWEVSTGKMLQKLKGHSQSVSCVSFSPDEITLASGSLDGTIRFWRE